MDPGLHLASVPRMGAIPHLLIVLAEGNLSASHVHVDLSVFKDVFSRFLIKSNPRLFSAPAELVGNPVEGTISVDDLTMIPPLTNLFAGQPALCGACGLRNRFTVGCKVRTMRLAPILPTKDAFLVDEEHEGLATTDAAGIDPDAAMIVDVFVQIFELLEQSLCLVAATNPSTKLSSNLLDRLPHELHEEALQEAGIRPLVSMVRPHGSSLVEGQLPILVDGSPVQGLLRACARALAVVPLPAGAPPLLIGRLE